MFRNCVSDRLYVCRPGAVELAHAGALWLACHHHLAGARNSDSQQNPFWRIPWWIPWRLALAAKDPTLAPLVKARPGLRVPGAWDGFELAIRAVLGQQITVTAAARLAGRLVAAYGERLAAADEYLTHVFPRPESLASAIGAAREVAGGGRVIVAFGCGWLLQRRLLLIDRRVSHPDLQVFDEGLHTRLPSHR